jgi:ubiquinol-cytochrome c reductase cytochrome c1 subunit
MRRVSLLLAPLVLAGGLLAARPATAEDLPHVDWSFDGIFGTYDRASAQRGFQVYQEVSPPASRCQAH